MAVGELIRGIPGLELHGDAGVMVSGIAYDSRKVKPGDLFAAIPGASEDGARYIPQALAAGAAAVLAGKAVSLSAPLIVASEVRLCLGNLAGRFFGHPDHRLELTGITGTNGKTTVSYLLESILAAAGHRPGVIGTIAYRFGSEQRPAPVTTPESTDLFELLAWMLGAGADHAVMEISSHALDQKRVAGLRIKNAVFTNLSRDHLDYHRDLEDYYQAKKKLFAEVIPGKWIGSGDAPDSGPAPRVAINLDDEHGARLFSELGGEGLEAWGYGVKSGKAAVRAQDIETTAQGTRALITGPGFRVRADSKLVGGHNLENILAAAAVSALMGVPPSAIEEGVRALAKVPGRLEPVANAGGFALLVDYAHTPDALAHAVAACRDLAAGRLITVFGCGGDRDPGKRPLMGRIAVEGSDLAVVTSDNPRTEAPLQIIEQILSGIADLGVKEINPDREPDGRTYAVIPDRKRAIEQAVRFARPGDVVLIAGKGHEDYQILGRNKIHFDDREEAGEALRKRGL